ncbi:MAG: caspase family protein [Paramuribaculum sp.]|nr:caspase family protein [Paramuribaculum sp.]
MKKIAIFLIAALLCVAGLQARTFVLATGVSNYGGANNLTQTTKDAKQFKKVMETQTKDITLLTSSNVTKAKLLEALRAICNRAQQGDNIIFFYSGHGMPGAICAYDTPVSYDDIVGLLSKSKASAKICFIDACHAGTAVDSSRGTEWTGAVNGTQDQVFIVSCRPEELSVESPTLGAGFFTQALLNGLVGKSDENGDKKITVLELFKYIHGDVIRRSKDRQHPQLIAPKSMYNTVVTKWK